MALDTPESSAPEGRAQKSPQELGALARRLAATNAAEAARIRESLDRGFYGPGSVPQARRQHITAELFQQLLDRIQERRIDARALEHFARWLDTDPELPDGDWYKVLTGLTVYGEGALVKTILRPGESARGTRVR